MIHEPQVIQTDSQHILATFTELSQLLPQNSKRYTIYLYHLRQLALILEQEIDGDDYTSTLRLLTKIGAELPIS